MYIKPIIVALRVRQNIIFELCGRIGHNDDSCTICGPNLLPPSLGRNTNQFNALNGREQN